MTPWKKKHYLLFDPPVGQNNIFYLTFWLGKQSGTHRPQKTATFTRCFSLFSSGPPFDCNLHGVAQDLQMWVQDLLLRFGLKFWLNWTKACKYQ